MNTGLDYSENNMWFYSPMTAVKPAIKPEVIHLLERAQISFDNGEREEAEYFAMIAMSSL